MAGLSNYAYRQLIRRLGGVGLPATEMIGAQSSPANLTGVCHSLEPTAPGRQAASHPAAGPRKRGQSPPERLWGVKEEPRPLAVQIWDNDPGTLAAVGRRLAEEYQPAWSTSISAARSPDVAKRPKAASYLLRYPDRVGRIVARVAAACRPVPVTAKIRTRLHPRHDQRHRRGAGDRERRRGGGDRPRPHGRRPLSRLGQLGGDRPHQAALGRIPLIGNGDLSTRQASCRRSPAMVSTA